MSMHNATGPASGSDETVSLNKFSHVLSLQAGATCKNLEAVSHTVAPCTKVLMPLRVIKRIPEIVQVQWKVPNFFSYNMEKGERIVSPSFWFAGRSWNLIVYPKGDKKKSGRGCMSAFLCMETYFIVARSITFKTKSLSIALKTEEGRTVKEKTLINHAFIEHLVPSCGWKTFLGLRNYKYRQMRESKDAVVFTCRVQREVAILERLSPNAEELGSKRMIFVDLEDEPKSFSKDILDDKACDITINVRRRVFQAHRAVLAARSPVFRAMFEHNTSEAKTGILKIPDCNPESFDNFLSFLYTDKLELDSFSAAQNLYFIADKYDLQRVKFYCADYLKKSLTTENICEFVLLADMHRDKMLMSSGRKFFKKNSEKIMLTSVWKDDMVVNHPRLVRKLVATVNGRRRAKTRKTTKFKRLKKHLSSSQT